MSYNSWLLQLTLGIETFTLELPLSSQQDLQAKAWSERLPASEWCPLGSLGCGTDTDDGPYDEIRLMSGAAPAQLEGDAEEAQKDPS